MTMRDVRVTARTGTPRIRMGHDDAPATYNATDVRPDGTTTHRPRAIPVPTRSVNAHRHVVVNYAHDHALAGFVRDVRPGDARANGASRPTTAPNMDDMRHPDARDGRGYVATGATTPTHNADGTYRPMRRVTVNTATGARVMHDDNANGGIITPRRVRTVADGDDRLAGVRRADMVRDGARTPRTARTPRATGRTTTTPTDRLADVRAFAAAHGIPIEKIADRRVVAAIRDVMAHRAAVAAYAAR